jgi:hypothetical protein
VSSELPPAGYVERDPRPVTEFGRRALSGVGIPEKYVQSEEDAAFMAYAGYPELQNSFVEASGNQPTVEPPKTAETLMEKETPQERFARTRYVATSTPLHRDASRKTETLTTEVL